MDSMSTDTRLVVIHADVHPFTILQRVIERYTQWLLSRKPLPPPDRKLPSYRLDYVATWFLRNQN